MSCGIPVGHSTPISSQSGVQNPLVQAGLVPANLADILITNDADDARNKHGGRRITGIRVLTSNEYVNMMREKENKKREAAKQKQKHKEKRELK